MIEIERKFRLTSTKKEAIYQYMTKKHGDVEPVHQSDQVFLQGINSFKDFKRHMPVVRLRTANGKTLFTFKRAINEAGDSLEHEVMVDSAETMEKILEEMDYQQVTLVVKDRIEVKDGGLTLALDHVNRLGDFLEIELLRAEAGGDAEAIIMRKAAEFALTAADIETKKYDELLDAVGEFE